MKITSNVHLKYLKIQIKYIIIQMYEYRFIIFNKLKIALISFNWLKLINWKKLIKISLNFESKLNRSQF